MSMRITKPYHYSFSLTKPGLVAIFVSARSQSKKQIKSNIDEDLRVEINGLEFREVPPEKYKQLFNVPPAFNGSKLKGLKKTVVFLMVLTKGKHIVSLIPGGSSFIESVKIQELGDSQEIVLDVEEQAEDGNTRPWHTFVLVDLPLKTVSADVTVKWRFRDSDDLKMIIDNEVKKNNLSILHKNWLWSANIFKKFFKKERQEKTFEENLAQGIHYLEFWADRMPVLHKVVLDVGKIEPKRSEYNDPPKIAEGFNERYVLKDEAFSDKDSMSEKEIQNFLDKYHQDKEKNHLSKMTFDGKSAAYWLKKAAKEYNINPKLLLTKLQTEQGLIRGDFSVNPTQKQLDYAMNVGKLDTGVTLEGFSGFVNQIINATYYLRKHYDEADLNNFAWTVQKSFAEKDFTKIKVNCINASTYSLYRFTPWLYEGGRLVYNVYRELFGTDDLGGEVNTSQTGAISFKKILITASCLMTIIGLLFIGTYLSIRNKPLFNWQNVTVIKNNVQLITKIDITSQKYLTVEDGLYCGTPFYKTYQGDIKLFLIKDGKIIDSIDLTNPDLIFKNLSQEELIYYKPWDIDGDGKKQEFVIQEYAGCNGNLFSFIQLNKNLSKLEKIPVIHQDGYQNFVLYVAPGDDRFKAENGVIRVEYYDNTQGEWFRDWYEYDKEMEVLKWTRGESPLANK